MVRQLPDDSLALLLSRNHCMEGIGTANISNNSEQRVSGRDVLCNDAFWDHIPLQGALVVHVFSGTSMVWDMIRDGMVSSYGLTEDRPGG